ncbi:MAG: hypothetical protein ACOYB1_10180 [Limnohabitans sp.]
MAYGVAQGGLAHHRLVAMAKSIAMARLKALSTVLCGRSCKVMLTEISWMNQNANLIHQLQIQS